MRVRVVSQFELLKLRLYSAHSGRMTRLTYDDASHTEGCTGGKRACVRASERATTACGQESLSAACAGC